jgi:hypothetical protein
LYCIELDSFFKDGLTYTRCDAGKRYSVQNH